MATTEKEPAFIVEGELEDASVVGVLPQGTVDVTPPHGPTLRELLYKLSEEAGSIRVRVTVEIL